MRAFKWGLALTIGLVLVAFTACSFNFTTARIRGVKVSKDEDGKQEATTFGPGEKVYVIADIGNNVGKMKVKFRVLYDNVTGKDAGATLSGAEKVLDVEGSRPAIFWISLPKENFANGSYKAEVTLLTEDGEEKGKTSATFKVEGFNASKDSANQTSEDSTAAKDKPANGEESEPPVENASARENNEELADSFGNGTFEGFCRNRISGQRAKLSLELKRTGNDITGSVFVGPPLRGSGVASGQVNGNRIELTLETRDVRQKWIIWIHGKRLPGGGFEGNYNISDGQYGVFSVDPVGE